MKTVYIVLGVIVVAIVAIALFGAMQGDQGGEEITSYEECVAAGYPILESYPEQCRTPDGKSFTRELRDDELSPDVAAHIDGKSDLITVSEPEPLAVVESPLTIRGEARGNWHFEATFPVRIEDADGDVLGEHHATAQDEWMTEEFVPFEAELTFSAPSTATGALIFEKANPSGLEENADELRIPVRFDEDATAQRTVTLHYYNEDNDRDAEGNIMCSEAGLVPVEREITMTQTPIQDTIRLLLEGNLTEEEREQGVTTEYPLEGVELTGASLNDSVLTLSFDDPNARTSGGSCRTGILWLQIRETAKQFENVDEVHFQPEELFQP